MNFEANRSILFSDTLISDIFITEYMSDADGDYVKVYLYCLFLGKHNRPVTINDMSKKLGMDVTKVRQAFSFWENVGAFLKKESGVAICDLKEKEVHRLYRPKLTSTPEEAKHNTEKNIKRSQVLTAINNLFFQGVMQPGWYMDIDAWFAKYAFEEDVMLSLFKYCFDRRALNKNYVISVAESWHSKGIKNSFDLDNYFIEYEKSNEIKKKISKKLSITRKLTEFEEAYIDCWMTQYGYGFDIIEHALKKTTSKTNPSFDYINGILTDWHKKGLKTIEEIQNDIKQFKEQNKTNRAEKAISNKHFGEDINLDLSGFYRNLKSKA
jgi:DnaD/phage-associated family protein